jgi:hypothetical protein
MTRRHSTGHKKFSKPPGPANDCRKALHFCIIFLPLLQKFRFPSSVYFDSLPARKFSFPGGAKWLQGRGWKEVHGGWKTNRTTPCFITASQSHFFPSHGRTSGLLPWEQTGMWSHCARTQRREEKRACNEESHTRFNQRLTSR